MKFLRIGKEGQEIPVALDKDGKYRNLSSIIKDLNSDTINFETIDKIKDINLESLEEISQNERIGSCISKPGNFFAIGLNYVEHAKETGAKTPENPVLFNKSVHSIVGPNDNVIIPKTSKKLDHEVEIAFVIGKKAKRVLEKDAQDYIFGYCICNDISEREWQKEKGGQWVKGKSGDTFGPLGPWLVTKDEIENPHELRLWLSLNGKMMQDENTNDLIFNIPQLISYSSQFMTLLPGDVISTGTPAGVGLGFTPNIYLKEGDVVELGIDGLGTSKQNVIAYKP